MARAFLLDDAVPLLTLTGPGGVGKTRLALAVAQDVATHFADGVVWVDLAPLTDPALVPATVAAALALTHPADQPIAVELVRWLRSRQTLLVFDNCEHVLAAAADLVASLLVACPALQVVATSRAPLQIRGEQILPVEPLPLPAVDAPMAAIAEAEATQLFVVRARAVRPAFHLERDNAATVALLCRHLDGLPLAIELAAAQSATLSPAVLLEQMTDRLRLLRGGARDLPARHQTIRATIAWSYALLSDAEQAAFRALAVFAGGWTIPAASAVLAQDEHDTSGLLQRLTAHSLVVAQVQSDGDRPRFTLLETIRAFGLEQLAEHGEEHEVRDRHAAFFLDLAERAELHLHGVAGDQAGWFRHVDAEFGNMRAAVTWFLTQHEGTRALRIIVGLEGFMSSRFNEREVRPWIEAALVMSPDAPPRLLAGAYYSLVSRAAHTGDMLVAASAADLELAQAEAAQDPLEIGRALISVTWISREMGEPEDSTERLVRAVSLLRRTDRADFLGLALTELGLARLAAGDLDLAQQLLDEALTVNGRTDDQWGRTVCLNQRAKLARVQADYAGAVRLCEQAIITAQALGDQRLIMWIVAELTHVMLATNQPERAARLLGAITTQQEATGFRGVLADSAVAQMMTAVRAVLGEAAFTQAWEAGRQFSWPYAVAAALAALEPEPAPTMRAPSSGNPLPASFDLTRREQDILALLCQRQTNAEMAAALFLSPRTVETHVSHVIDKLGASNRREAAALAVRGGFV